MNLKIWQIPRSDTRERCNKCLFVLKEKQWKTRMKHHTLFRFPYLCKKCKTKQDAGIT